MHNVNPNFNDDQITKILKKVEPTIRGVIQKSQIRGFDAEEVWLDASYQFVLAWERYSHGWKVKFRFGLARIITRRCVFKYIHQKTKRTEEHRQYCEEMAGTSDCYYPTDEHQEQIDDADIDLKQLLATLPIENRQAIQLHCLEGLTLAEIGRMFDAAPCTILRRRDRGIAMLQDRCKGYLQDWEN